MFSTQIAKIENKKNIIKVSFLDLFSGISLIFLCVCFYVCYVVSNLITNDKK